MGDNENRLIIPKKFKSLDQLKDFLEEIEIDLNSGVFEPSDIDFIPLFSAFKNLIRKKDLSNLEKGVSLLGDTSDIFKQKIDKIQEYINRIAFDDTFKVFLTNYKDEESLFSAILQKCWRSPLTIETISLNYLDSSFKRWANRKINYEKKEFLEPKKVNYSGTFDLEYDLPFQKSLSEFFSSIEKKLPCKLSDILSEALNMDDYYNWFIYILHLIQKHRIVYNKDNEIVSKPGVI
ncbi:MAG: hypothetical protein GY870_05155 [archaeon]|nr:hypothetical protein [archaeon]